MKKWTSEFFRKVIFIAFLLGVSLLSFELSSALLYTLETGSLFSYSVLARERKELLQKQYSSQDLENINIKVPWNIEIHPFFGTGYPKGFKILEKIESDGNSAQDEHFIIALTGGSVAQAVFNEFTGALKSELKKKGIEGTEKISFLLLGQGTWKQPQQVAAIVFYLSMGGKLNLLINLDGHNEVVDTKFNRDHGIFLAYPWLWHYVASNVVAAEDLRIIGYIRFLRGLRHHIAQIAERMRFSITFNVSGKLADNMIKSKIEKAQFDLQRLTKTSEKSKPFYITGPKQEFSSEEEFYSSCSAIWEHGSVQLNNLAISNGASYIHFLQPNQYFPGSKKLTKEEQSCCYDPRRKGVIKGYPWLLRAGNTLRSKGIEFICLTDIFKQVGESVYGDDCCHLNARGNELLAQVMARDVARHITKLHGKSLSNL